MINVHPSTVPNGQGYETTLGMKNRGMDKVDVVIYTVEFFQPQKNMLCYYRKTDANGDNYIKIIKPVPE